MTLPQQILVGFDSSPLSELGLHRALRMAKKTRFCIVHVVCMVETTPTGVRLPGGQRLTPWGASDYLRHSVERLAQCWGISETLSALHLRSCSPSAGRISEALVDLAYRFHADSIVLGARGWRSMHGPSIGPVAKGVLELSEIPVHLESPLNLILSESSALEKLNFLNGRDEPPSPPLDWSLC